MAFLGSRRSFQLALRATRASPCAIARVAVSSSSVAASRSSTRAFSIVSSTTRARSASLRVNSTLNVRSRTADATGSKISLRIRLMEPRLRSYHESKAVSSSSSSTTAAAAATTKKKGTRLDIEGFKYTQIALAVAFPAGLILSPSPLNLPLDIVISAAVPLHTYVGMHDVFDDYMPSHLKEIAMIILKVVVALMGIGLLRLSVQGPGVTESIKSIWRAPPARTGLSLEAPAHVKAAALAVGDLRAPEANQRIAEQAALPEDIIAGHRFLQKLTPEERATLESMLRDPPSKRK